MKKATENNYEAITYKAKKASKVQGIAIIVAKALSLIFAVFLARILTPDDFGYLTVTIVFTSFLTIFSTSGFQTFLIQNTSKTASTKTFYTRSFLLILGFLSCWSFIINCRLGFCYFGG